MARKLTVKFVRAWRQWPIGAVHEFDLGLGKTLVDKGWAVSVVAPEAKAIATGTVRNKAMRKAVVHGA